MLGYDPPRWLTQHIYITSDEEIKGGDWIIENNNLGKCTNELWVKRGASILTKKIILTTDQDLIKDGVQGIDDEFLEWFVKNPSCEFADVNDWMDTNGNIAFGGNTRYQLCNHLYNKQIIPREELKETLEEAAENYAVQFLLEDEQETDSANRKQAFKEGAKWMQERMYSEEDMRLAIKKARDISDGKDCFDAEDISGCTEVCTYSWRFNMSEDSIIEQFKK
jgi:hypothetical protein